MMEDSHFNSSYFWSPIPTVPGQVSLNKESLVCSLFRTDVKRVPGLSNFKKSPLWWQLENAMFLNKVKEQQEKNASFSTSSGPHYQTALLTIPTPGSKTDGGGPAGSVAHLHPPHSGQNMLPMPSTGIMTTGEEKPLGLFLLIPQYIWHNIQWSNQIRRTPKFKVGLTSQKFSCEP